MRYVLVALLLVSALSGAAVAQEAPDIGAATTFDVDLQADGNADWTVRTTIPFDTDEERAGFRQYAERFEDGEVSSSPGLAFFESAAAASSSVADREMNITSVEREYTVGNGSGTLQLRFHWTNFLAPAGDGYELSDALLTEDGTWLRSLESGQEIAVRTPQGYEIQRSSIEARQENDSLVVVGPESFDPQEFSITYAPEAGNGPGESPDSPNGPEDGFDPFVTVLLGLLFVAVIVLAVWRWRGGEPIAEVANGDSSTLSTDDDEAVPDASDAEESGVDPELLSDEERVETLLEQNGGRMRQADIVKETDWSDAKVSQLLSRMADEGSIEKLRLGRENVISLPDGEDEE
ncbi:helix-turn-helix transcriptional regulator [Halolamina sediminis]|uniref:helix-turn-helix transcriptional regulator n=1 Tax=Halolamina sediminis TaxID=1480675 RepID=UPI0006B4FA0A|nr:transcriptional regulator [Halolamina sediminis]